jgi:hypothetical protein
VYIAKLAVLISTPRIRTTHCPLSGFGLSSASREFGAKGVTGRGALHGVERSASRTPFSRASCSSVTGMKEPIPHTTKTFACQCQCHFVVVSYGGIAWTLSLPNRGAFYKVPPYRNGLKNV